MFKRRNSPSKSKEYKNMCEEVYYLTISGAENDTELDELKMKAWFKSILFKCKANDLVCAKFDYDEHQMEDAFEEFGFKKKDDEKRTKQREDKMKA